jgi:hypothetical protein
MKKIFIIFLFVFNLGGNQIEIKDNKSGRIHIRMPYTGIAPKHKPTLNPYQKQWEKWWSYQLCGYCEELADECWWLKKQKGNIKQTWTKTVISKEIPVRFVRLGNKGNPQGFALTTKSGKIVKIKTR